MKIVDPMKELPPIKTKGKEVDPKYQAFLQKSIEILEKSKNNTSVEEDGFTTVENKKRKKSEEKRRTSKLKKKNTP